MDALIDPHAAGIAEGMAAAQVRCRLCVLPVARSRSDPPVLLRRDLARHGSSRQSALDFFVADPCPQEGVAVPAEFRGLLPPAPLDPFGPEEPPPASALAGRSHAS